MLPNDHQIAPCEVVPVVQEVGGTKLRLSQDAYSFMLKEVVRERCTALNYAVTQSLRALREDLSDVEFTLWHKRHLSHRSGFHLSCFNTFTNTLAAPFSR